MNIPNDIMLVTRRLKLLMLIVSLITGFAITPKVCGEEEPKTEAKEAEPVVPTTTELPTPAGTLPPIDESNTPEQILNAALEAMDRAALDLEADVPTEQAVQDQQIAVELLQKLLSSTPQSSASSLKHSSPNQPSSSDNPADQQPSDSNSADSKGDGNRRSDDENSEESSENVAGPTQSDTTTLIPNAKANSVWGHLPRREQETLLRSLSDNFLPEYETQIKRYYEALAEGKQGSRGR